MYHLRRRRCYSRRAPRWARAPQRATSRRSAAIRTFTRARAIKSTAGCRRRARRPRLPTGVPQVHAFRAPRTVGVWVQTKLVDWQMPDLSEFPVPRRRRSPRVPAIRSSRLACAPLQLKPYVAYGADPRAKHRRRRLPHPFSTRYLHRARLHAHIPPCLSRRQETVRPGQGARRVNMAPLMDDAPAAHGPRECRPRSRPVRSAFHERRDGLFYYVAVRSPRALVVAHG